MKDSVEKRIKNNRKCSSSLSCLPQADGYDPKKSKVSTDTMEQWRVKAVTASLLDVPGIGPAAVKKLAEGDMDDKVSNTYQLFGKVRHG